MPAFFSALLSSKGKRLGDYAAGTYVVRERVRLRAPAPADDAAAAGAAGQRGADIASLPTGLAVAIRQFLGRVHADRARRPPVARGSGSPSRPGRTSPRRHPPGTPPEAFLAAVIAARRDRDQARLAREDELRRRLTARR